MDGNEIRPSSPWFGLLLTLGLVLQFFVVMLLAGWAALTPGDCRPRIAIVLVIAVLFGPLPPYFFRGGTRQYAVFTGTWLGYASLLSASLLFFRACGYRLVRVAPRR